MKLNKQQQAFVEAYCANGFNATQAAITAGYSARTAHSQGPRLLEHVEVKAQISAFTAKASEKALVTTEDLVKLLHKEATSDNDATTPAARVAAIKVLGDYTGGFDANKQKVEHSGTIETLTDEQLDAKLKALIGASSN